MKATVKKAYGIASKTVELSLVDIMAINNAKKHIDEILSKNEAKEFFGSSEKQSQEQDLIKNPEVINVLNMTKNLLTRLGIDELNLQPSDIFSEYNSNKDYDDEEETNH